MFIVLKLILLDKVLQLIKYLILKIYPVIFLNYPVLTLQ